jgi:hypothetical protein
MRIFKVSLFLDTVVFLWVWNGVHSALVRINEELLERKSSGSGLEN